MADIFQVPKRSSSVIGMYSGLGLRRAVTDDSRMDFAMTEPMRPLASSQPPRSGDANSWLFLKQ